MFLLYYIIFYVITLHDVYMCTCIGLECALSSSIFELYVLSLYGCTFRREQVLGSSGNGVNVYLQLWMSVNHSHNTSLTNLQGHTFPHTHSDLSCYPKSL